MADLLECLIQIKGLADSLQRLERLALVVRGETDDSPESRARTALAARLESAERACASALGVPAEPAPEAAGPQSMVAALESFTGLRRRNIDRLEALSAAELAAQVCWPGRGPTTVADLVAVMLARDTETLGELGLLASGRPERR